MFQPYLESKRRIVVYNSEPVNTHILMSTMRHVAENRDSNDVVLARADALFDARLEDLHEAEKKRLESEQGKQGTGGDKWQRADAPPLVPQSYR